MNDNTPRITRRRYIDTLTRWVGPFMRWQVVTPDNSNSRAFSPAQAGDRVSSRPIPTQFVNAHEAAYTGETA